MPLKIPSKTGISNLLPFLSGKNQSSHYLLSGGEEVLSRNTMVSVKVNLSQLVLRLHEVRLGTSMILWSVWTVFILNSWKECLRTFMLSPGMNGVGRLPFVEYVFVYTCFAYALLLWRRILGIVQTPFSL